MQKSTTQRSNTMMAMCADACQDEVHEVEETNIKTAIRTDHSAITISFNILDEQTRGPSYWKFNSSLVDDENYVLAISIGNSTVSRGIWDKYRE